MFTQKPAGGCVLESKPGFYINKENSEIINSSRLIYNGLLEVIGLENSLYRLIEEKRKCELYDDNIKNDEGAFTIPLVYKKPSTTHIYFKKYKLRK